MVRVVSRPYAMRVAGTPTEMLFADDTLTLAFERASGLARRLFVPERFTIARALCDETETALETHAGVVDMTCGESGAHRIVLQLEGVD